MKDKLKMSKIFIVLCLVVVILISPSTVYHISADPHFSVVTLYANEKRFKVNDNEYALSDDVLLYYSNIFIPVDDILPKCGFTLGWDDGLKAVVAVKNNVYSYILSEQSVVWVGPKKCEYDLPSMIYHDKLYISLAMFNDITNFYVSLEGELQETAFNKRDLLHTTAVPDDFRLPNEDISYAKGVTMAGTFAFERVGIFYDAAMRYADAVNAVAKALPNVKTYNIVVPTSAEFYAPKEMAPNQTDTIRSMYERLCDEVIPINAIKPLTEHAGEKIYFSTDHHWTQRGAYYVYKAYAENKGFELPDILEFQTVNSTTHVGSFAGFANGTAVGEKIKANPELLERFMPSVEVNGSAYTDMYMQNRYRSVVPVDTNINSYLCFIGGDNPLTVFTTNVGNGKKAVIIKESFGNAFSTWALNNYSEVYVVDLRSFNGFNGSKDKFSLLKFYDMVRFDDLIIINYPISVSSDKVSDSILAMAEF